MRFILVIFALLIAAAVVFMALQPVSDVDETIQELSSEVQVQPVRIVEPPLSVPAVIARPEHGPSDDAPVEVGVIAVETADETVDEPAAQPAEPTVPSRPIHHASGAELLPTNSAEDQAAREEREREVRRQQFRDDIQDAFRADLDELRGCYEVLLELEPDLADRIVVSLTIDQADSGDYGVATLDAIESGEMDIEHLICFADVISEMQFPTPEHGSYAISYPLTFSPE